MDLRFRLFDGSLDDAVGVLEVEAASWNESAHSPQTLQAMLTSREHEQACWLAESSGTVVGFVHAFLTHAAMGASWEVDLLAVAPEWRGRGAATELIRRSVSAAPGSAVRGRALVAADNAPSATAFTRAGFSPETALHGIYVRDVPESEPLWPDSIRLERAYSRRWRATLGGPAVDLQEVRTILYSGVWVDGFAGVMPTSLLRAALALAFRRRLEVVGVVIPLSDRRAARLLTDEGYESLGNYHVWTRSLAPADARRSSLEPGERA